MKIIDCFRVESYGSHILLGRFTNSEIAEHAKLKAKGYGAVVVSEKIVIMDEIPDEFPKNSVTSKF